MKLHIFTLALDAMPFLPMQLNTFNRLACDWQWTVVEGAAMNVKDTSWCKQQSPRLSRDGTTEFLNSLRGHPRIRVLQQQRWDGKVAMCNAALETFKQPGLLLQVDADELWSPDQIDRLSLILESSRSYNCARFYCRYFVGPNIVITSDGNYGNRDGEWLRAWRFTPGMRFLRHEPPQLSPSFSDPVERCLSKSETREMKLVFDHYSWAFTSQVSFKETFYGYSGALSHWRRLQSNTQWPCELRTFLPWVDPGVTANLLHK